MLWGVEVWKSACARCPGAGAVFRSQFPFTNVAKDVLLASAVGGVALAVLLEAGAAQGATPAAVEAASADALAEGQRPPAAAWDQRLAVLRESAQVVVIAELRSRGAVYATQGWAGSASSAEESTGSACCGGLHAPTRRLIVPPTKVKGNGARVCAQSEKLHHACPLWRSSCPCPALRSWLTSWSVAAPSARE